MQDGWILEGDGKEKTAFSRRPAALIGSEDSAEALLRTTLDALSAHIAVLDETGLVISVNAAWRAFAVESGYSGPDHGVGANYIAVCERSANASEDAARTARALKDIIAGRLVSFRMEYPCQSPNGVRWFQLRVTSPGPMPVRRVVIAHEDITEVKRAQESLARLSARIMQLQDDERRRIARELHDTTAQNLLAITLSAARMRNAQRKHDYFLAGITSEILTLAEQSLQEVRTLSYLLHPPLLDEVGLEAALRWLAKGFGERSGIATEVRIDDLPFAPTPEVATAIFRVAQEALSNVHRHAGSPWARISLRLSAGWLELRVEDGGSGIRIADREDAPADMQTVGVGISGMRVRAAQLGGQLELATRKPGLLVRALFPAMSRQAVAASEAKAQDHE